MFHSKRILIKGLTFHPGFLVNSEELARLVHIPSTSQLKELEVPIDPLETLTILKKAPHLRAGTKIGTYDRAGTIETVYIPGNLSLRNTHIIGKPDMGKTCLIPGTEKIERMAFLDVL